MRLLKLTRIIHSASLVAALIALAVAWPAAAQTSIKFSLDGRLEGLAATFFLPQDRGYFKSEGLDVTVDEATTALEPITRVASGAYEMALADINTLIRYRDQHPTSSLKAVFMLYNKPPFAIVARRSRGITEPKQLEGKKLGTPPVGVTFEWPLFAKLNNVDAAKVTIETIGFPVRAPMLAAGQIDAALGYSFRLYVDLKDRGVPVDDIVLMPMADYGLKLYGNTIIINPKFAAEKPEAVKGFVRAVIGGMHQTVRDVGRAVDEVVNRMDSGSRDLELERLRTLIRDNIVTSEVQRHGIGGIDPARFDRSIDQIAEDFKFQKKPSAANIFDDSFLPPLGGRLIN